MPRSLLSLSLAATLMAALPAQKSWTLPKNHDRKEGVSLDDVGFNPYARSFGTFYVPARSVYSYDQSVFPWKNQVALSRRTEIGVSVGWNSQVTAANLFAYGPALDHTDPAKARTLTLFRTQAPVVELR